MQFVSVSNMDHPFGLSRDGAGFGFWVGVGDHKRREMAQTTNWVFVEYWNTAAVTDERWEERAKASAMEDSCEEY